VATPGEIVEARTPDLVGTAEIAEYLDLLRRARVITWR
jgi:hypothetical protein